MVADLRDLHSAASGLDTEVLDLGVRSVRYGGASVDEICVMFGWTEMQHFARLQAL